ncbi:uncharacterized protein LY89DRAFT_756450 [Mollisia scopiformis]|uniref:Uncharacterized protein n=1 Tax=Mollisia scopiformis TaxID=149040 RepID=A0A194WZP5_MOLSC|nr:uncharacterized protein LY89DRAFT_756450 [Mollisia scopiformis]KUJ13087.1 hypothetical protein LY89DRAFT_756450 [Mollisia scopiformis]
MLALLEETILQSNLSPSTHPLANPNRPLKHIPILRLPTLPPRIPIPLIPVPILLPPTHTNPIIIIDIILHKITLCRMHGDRTYQFIGRHRIRPVAQSRPRGLRVHGLDVAGVVEEVDPCELVGRVPDYGGGAEVCAGGGEADGSREAEVVVRDRGRSGDLAGVEGCVFGGGYGFCGESERGCCCC